MEAYQQVIAAWNAQADEHNQWDALGEDEKIEWALKCADQFRGATKMMAQEPVACMTGIELAKLGKCGLCEGAALAHGPWSDEQIAEAIEDTGEPDFEDWCDQCLIDMCFCGDPQYAARLLNRPVQVGHNAQS